MTKKLTGRIVGYTNLEVPELTIQLTHGEAKEIPLNIDVEISWEPEN